VVAISTRPPVGVYCTAGELLPRPRISLVVGSPGDNLGHLCGLENASSCWMERIGYDANLHCPLSDTLLGCLFLAVLCFPKTVPT
jgi:hypothetical protein